MLDELSEGENGSKRRRYLNSKSMGIIWRDTGADLIVGENPLEGGIDGEGGHGE